MEIKGYPLPMVGHGGFTPPDGRLLGISSFGIELARWGPQLPTK
jgi:hypothetical protein